MTNLEFIRKAAPTDLAKFLEKRLVCSGKCFLAKEGRCDPDKGCRENIREWLKEKMA